MPRSKPAGCSRTGSGFNSREHGSTERHRDKGRDIGRPLRRVDASVQGNPQPAGNRCLGPTYQAHPALKSRPGSGGACAGHVLAGVLPRIWRLNECRRQWSCGISLGSVANCAPREGQQGVRGYSKGENTLWSVFSSRVLSRWFLRPQGLYGTAHKHSASESSLQLQVIKAKKSQMTVLLHAQNGASKNSQTSCEAHCPGVSSSTRRAGRSSQHSERTTNASRSDCCRPAASRRFMRFVDDSLVDTVEIVQAQPL